MSLTNLKNEKLKSVTLSPDRKVITFTLRDGNAKVFYAKGDCCSSSWIEHLELPSNVDGAKVLRVEEADLPRIACNLCGTTHDSSEKGTARCVFDTMQEQSFDSDNYIKVYRTTIVTDRGCIDIEYRNSSNGYYGGWLEEEEF